MLKLGGIFAALFAAPFVLRAAYVATLPGADALMVADRLAPAVGAAFVGFLFGVLVRVFKKRKAE